MKKEHLRLPFLLFACYCILPLFCTIGLICSYDFVLRSYSVCSVVLAIFCLIASVCLFISKLQPNKIDMIFSTLLLPMSAVNGIAYLIHSHTKFTVIFVLISCCCAVAVFIKFAGNPALKIVFGILSVLLFLLLLLILIQGYLSRNTVVKSVSSPQNMYVAEVIDNDQGALGGNTLVDVKAIGKRLIYMSASSRSRPFTYTLGNGANLQRCKSVGKTIMFLLLMVKNTA